MKWGDDQDPGIILMPLKKQYHHPLSSAALRTATTHSARNYS